jgi:hypothetical protein
MFSALWQCVMFFSYCRIWSWRPNIRRLLLREVSSTLNTYIAQKKHSIQNFSIKQITLSTRMTYTFIRNSQFSFPSSSLNTFASMDSQASSYIHTYVHTCISQGRERPDCATFAQTEKKATWIEQQYCGKVWFSLWLVTGNLTAKLTCCSSRERKAGSVGWGAFLGVGRGGGVPVPDSPGQSVSHQWGGLLTHDCQTNLYSESRESGLLWQQVPFLCLFRTCTNC